MPGMRPSNLFLVALALLGACNSTYLVERAATVPHIEPLLRNGVPMEAPVEVQLGAGSVGDVMTPRAPDGAAAVEIPGLQFDAQGRVRVGKHVGLGVMLASGAASTARPARQDQLPVEGGNPNGAGLQLVASVPSADPHWVLGVGVEVMRWSVPYVESGVCTDCDEPYTWIERGRQVVPQLAVGATQTYRGRHVDLTGGLTLRSHPTIKRLLVERDGDSSGEVEVGTANLVASLGVDVKLGGGVRAGAVLYSSLNAAPVRYGPSLALTLTLPLGIDGTP